MAFNAKMAVYITNISWERVFLHFDIKCNLDETPSFELELFQAKTVYHLDDKLKAEKPKILRRIVIDPVSVAENTYHFMLNITCLDGRQFLDNGTWRIRVSTSGVAKDEAYVCMTSYDLAYRLEDKARIFRYGEGKYAYNVSFSTCAEEDDQLSFVMHSHFLIENTDWKERHYVQEAVTKEGRRKRIYMAFVIKLVRLYYRIVEQLSPKHGNKVLFMTETKGYLWGNLKYINDRIIERGLDQKFQLSYSLRNAVGQHMSIKSWVKMVTQVAKQDFIFVDDYVPIFGFLDLNPRTKLIQVWHAGEGFKAVGYCRFGKEGTPFPVGSCHKKYDYVITGSKRLVHIFEEVFGIPESAFLPIGMARLDGFLNEKTIENVRNTFYAEHPSFKEKKLILFAPTYRGVDQRMADYDYDQLDLDEIYDFCGEEWVWAFKMHPFIKRDPGIPEDYKDRIVDLSNCENINDLYYVTDLLITDYSSNYFEYALLKKPVLFFTYDREIYELTRGVHRPVKESAPGKVCDTFDEMMQALREQDFRQEKIEAFANDNFQNYDGNASDKIIDRILLGKGEETDE